jgi:23S rRNA (guanosine2251-2'-O)-methyltransferase
VNGVIQPKDRSAPLNDAAMKTASGAAAAIPVIEVVNLARTMKMLQESGVWIVGTTLNAEQTLTEIDLTGPIALVLGSEEKGIRAGTAKHCDYLATIPMLNDGFGFNVSVAAGICLYEVTRQRAIS